MSKKKRQNRGQKSASSTEVHPDRISSDQSEEQQTSELREIEGWTPQFEHFRYQRIVGPLSNLRSARGGMGEILGPSGLSSDAKIMMAQVAIKLTATELQMTDLNLFMKSAFVMSACLLVGNARISEECFPRMPMWIEYDRPRQILSSFPNITSLFFHCPFHERVISVAHEQEALTSNENRLATDLLAGRMAWGQTWLLEVYGADLQPIAQFQYNVKKATWDFGSGHAQVCPLSQCCLEMLGDDGFLVPCDACQAMLDLSSRLFVTSLLLREGSFRNVQEESDPFGQEKSEGKGTGDRGQPTSPQKAPLQPRHLTASGYVVIEFDASVCRRRKETTQSRPYWAEGRNVLDLNELEETLSDDAVVQVKLTYRGIKRTLRSDYFVKKKGQTIPVREYTVQVKMTYAAYQRRLQNKRITKVVACQFASLAVSNLSPSIS